MVLLLTGCMETIDIQLEEKPVLCINSLISAGRPIAVDVTHTWNYTDGNNIDKAKVDDAVITIFANGKQTNEDYIPKEGDKIRIIAESKKYGSAEAEVNVPFKTQFEPLNWETTQVSVKDVDSEYNVARRIEFNLKLDIKLSDIHKTPDYYLLRFRSFSKWDEIIENLPDTISHLETFIYFDEGNLKYEAEPLFFEHMGDWGNIFETDPSGFPFFTDQSFSGSDYTLNLQFTDCVYLLITDRFDPDDLNCGLVVSLHSISESYYLWEKYLFTSQPSVVGDIYDWGFQEPHWGYSNVSTGAGVMAAESVSYYTLNLKEFLENFFKE